MSLSRVLPSDPNKKIILGNYNVEHAIAVSSMNPELQEKFISKFLELLQTERGFIDPVTEMTAEDRKTILFLYAFHELDPEVLNTPNEYIIEDCPHCQKRHSFYLSLNQFREISKIKSIQEKEVFDNFKGKRIKIFPRHGREQEILEPRENKVEKLKRKSEKGEIDPGEYHKARVNLEIDKLLSIFSIVSEDNNKTTSELADEDEKFLHSLTISEFKEFKELVEEKLPKHGIDFSYNFKCPNKGGTIVCNIPFQFQKYIFKI